jgi:lipopolysaccharide biosynthesis glycosyltransferase
MLNCVFNEIYDMEIGIITLAYGSSKYIEMGKALGRSLQLNSPNIPSAIVTDRVEDEEISTLFNQVIPLREEYGSNVRQKLYLDQYSPYRKTLFVDSDSLVVSDLRNAFEKFEGKSFSVVGNRILRSGQKDNFCNLDRVLNHFNLEALPKFNGGVYYFTDDSTARSIFDTAREILSNFDDLSFSKFRGDGPADEPILATAMALHHQTMLPDYNIMLAPLGRKGYLDIDVLKGRAIFKSSINDSEVFSPSIVHFAGVWSENPIYYREMAKLKDLNSFRQTLNNPLIYNLQHWLGITKYSLWRISHYAKPISKVLGSQKKIKE